VTVVIFPDGTRREFPDGVTAADVLKTLGQRLQKEALVARVNGRLVDLSTPLPSEAVVTFLTFADEEGRDVYRHTSAHILAQAVKRLYPEAKLAIGPAIADGFYYDFDVPRPFTPEDLARIEAEMERIIKEDLPLERSELSREEARAAFLAAGETYKVEIIDELPPNAVISCYRQGEFTDLCAGPHLPSTGYVRAFKLLSVAGAYWRGDERNKMLQRIYGTSFPKKSLLEEHLHRLEEAKRRDHRRLAQLSGHLGGWRPGQVGRLGRQDGSAVHLLRFIHTHRWARLRPQQLHPRRREQTVRYHLVDVPEPDLRWFRDLVRRRRP